MTDDVKKNKWWHERFQSYLGIAGLILLATFAIYGDVDEAARPILEYSGMGCLLLIVQYTGATVKEIVAAWRGGTDG